MGKKQQNNKKTATVILTVIAAIGLFVLYKFFGPSVNKPEKGFLYIKTGTNLSALKDQLADENILPTQTWFDYTAKLLGYKNVKPGKYKINSGMSIFNLVRMLRNGQQTPVDFVVTKIRTKEQLAGKIGRAFECDSLAVITFLNNPDSLNSYGLDSNTVIAMVLPLTYESKWNIQPKVIFDKFYDAYKKFWSDERKQKAAAQGLTAIQATTLASIIDEETNAKSDRPKIASAYMNRVKMGMPLQADPTVKFALKDFEIKRVMFKHLEVASPYNTYKNKGWPPGPICTPQKETIDAVLNAPKTNYIYFVANSTFDGTHLFTSNYADHSKLAKQYQTALDSLLARKKAAAAP